LLCGTANSASVFLNGDPGAIPTGPRPNSDAMAARFDAVAGIIGTLHVIDFENLPIGNFTSLTVAPGVTVTLSGTDIDADAGIASDDDTILGYNTTPGGNKHLRVVPTLKSPTVSACFSFDSPIQVFGAYLTGVGTANGNLHVVFNDGSQQDLIVPGYTDGGVQFHGFISAGSSISSVTMEMRDLTGDSRDIFGIDDVRFVLTPEPATLLLLSLGSLLLRKKK
jgi:hypothetical protein